MWHDGKTIEETARNFSLKTERIKVIYRRAVHRMIHFIATSEQKHAQFSKMNEQINKLQNTINAYQARFDALENKNNKQKKNNKPSKEDFGDIKILATKVEETGLPVTIVWRLIYNDINNIAQLLNRTKLSLKEHKFNKPQIAQIDAMLEKYNLKMKEK